MRQCKQYDDDFKTMIVDLINSGKSYKDIFIEYGVPNRTARGWIKPKNSQTVTASDSDEIIALKKELARIKEENEILKKATAIFAKR